MTVLVLFVMTSCAVTLPISDLNRRAVLSDGDRFERRSWQSDAWTLPLSRIERSHPDLGVPREGSVAVGSTSDGYLVDGVQVPFDGLHHTVMAEHRGRGTGWGTTEMVDLILRAAGEVAVKHPGSLLPIGNISRGGGGAIPWSISHKSGRDADIGFYLLDESGQQVVLPSILPLMPPDGTFYWEGRLLTFDPARNWDLVNALLSSSAPRVQYIFCADFLISLMFKNARSRGVSDDRLDTFRPILRQPRGTLPHDDHMHVRIYCDGADRAEGCRDIVDGSEIIPRSDEGWKKRVRQCEALLRKGGGADRKAEALRMLAILRASGAREQAWKALAGCEEPLCLEAVRTLVSTSAAPRVELLVELIGRTEDPETAQLAFRLLRRAPSRYARKVVPLLKDDRTLSKPFFHLERELVVRKEACFALGWIGDFSSGEALAGTLADPDEEVRSAALWALRTIVAAEVWPDELVDDPFDGAVAAWKSWVKKHGSARKNLAATLGELGYRVRRLGREDARELVRAVLDEDHVSLNVQRLLVGLYRSKVPLSLDDKSGVHWRWKKVVRGN